MDLSARWSALEKARRERLRSLGVSNAALKASELKPIEARKGNCVRVMQWNLLADGMSDDGFLVNDVLKDWPAGVGNVPTCDGDVVKFDSLLTQMIAARGDDEALDRLKHRYSVPDAERNAEVTVDWQARELQIQLQVLAAGRPDLLVFQECDHYGPLSKGLAQLGYSSSMPSVDVDSVNAYEPAHLAGYNPAGKPDGAAEFQDGIEKKGYAFLPNAGSTAMNINLNRESSRARVLEAARKLGLESKVVDSDGFIKRRSFCGLETGPLLEEAHIDPASIDDDGVAIFWRTDRFSAVSLHVRLFPGGIHGGALQVKLREKSCPARHLVLFGVHLKSGDDLKSEESRLTQQVDVAGGLREMVLEAQKAGDPVVVSMDANSHPQIGADSGSSVWCSLHGALGASVWDSHFDTLGRLTKDGPPDPPVTSNKLRGPLSGQAKKIGLHSYYCIDHIFFTPKDFSLQGHALPPKQFPSDVEARGVLNPSLACPSDHYPVIVDLAWPPKGGAELKVASGKPASIFVRAAAKLLQGAEDAEPVQELYISALGSAIGVAAEVANSLESDKLGTIGRIYTDYQDMREPKPGKGSSWCPQIVIMVRNANANQIK